MTDQFRAICAELADALAEWRLGGGPPEDTADADLIDRARALLAEPVAEGPTDEELDSFLVDVACQHGNVYYSDPLILAHAVLTRWGRPAAQPVAVSERLPSAADCDEQGRCWLGGRQMGSGTPTWLLGYPAWAERFPDVHRFWLPANALPLPAPEGGEVQP